MKFFYALSLTNFVLMAQASSEPMITAVAKRNYSCVTLRDSPTDTGRDSPLTVSTLSTTSAAGAAVTCEHAANPDGAQRLYPDLGNDISSMGFPASSVLECVSDLFSRRINVAKVQSVEQRPNPTAWTGQGRDCWRFLVGNADLTCLGRNPKPL